MLSEITASIPDHVKTTLLENEIRRRSNTYDDNTATDNSHLKKNDTTCQQRKKRNSKGKAGGEEELSVWRMTRRLTARPIIIRWCVRPRKVTDGQWLRGQWWGQRRQRRTALKIIVRRNAIHHGACSVTPALYFLCWSVAGGPLCTLRYMKILCLMSDCGV